MNGRFATDIKKLVCPVSHKLFLEPVTNTCGHTLEKDCAVNLKEEGKSCPCCSKPLEAWIPNQLIEELVKSVIHDNSARASQQYLSDEHFAELIKSGETEKVLLALTSHPGKINAKMGKDRLTVLHQAIEANNTVLALSMLDKFKGQIDVNAQNSYKETPLYSAINADAPDIVKALLAHKADPTIDQVGTTPLQQAIHRFCYNNGNEQIVDLLLASEKNININQQCAPGYHTALLTAVSSDYKHIFDKQFKKLLSIEGINVNLRNKYNETALFVAAQCGRLEKVKMLLTFPGVEVGHRVFSIAGYKDELIAAKECGHTKIAGLLSGYHVTKSLLENQMIPAHVKLDDLQVLEADDFAVILKAMTNCGHEQAKVERIVDFLKRLTGLKVPDNGNFFKEEKDHAPADALNRLFQFAHNTYYKNSQDWEKKIRDQALHEFKASIGDKDANAATFELNWARSQTLFNKPRYCVSIGRTNAVIKLDKEIKNINKMR